MKLYCSFWGTCSPNKAEEAPQPTLANPPPKPIKLTTDIYNRDGSIKWSDPIIKNLLFSKGLQEDTIENYAFLYDCYEMDCVVQAPATEYTLEQKSEKIRLLAQEIYLKHIAMDSRQKNYFLLINGKLEEIKLTINISSEVRCNLDELYNNIDNAKATDILDKYDLAIKQILQPLYESESLPKYRFRILSAIKMPTSRRGIFSNTSTNTSSSSKQSSRTNPKLVANQPGTGLNDLLDSNSMSSGESSAPNTPGYSPNN